MRISDWSSDVFSSDLAGKSLVEWLKDDWLLFSHPRMDIAHAKELLGEILDDGEIVRRGFVPSASYISEGLAQWDKLRDEMMYANRWFLDVAIDLDRLRQLLRSEEHTSELQSLMRTSYAVFCLKKKKN